MTEHKKPLVYLAGPSREMGRCLHYAGKLVDSGLVSIASHWWERFRVAGSDDALITRERQAQYAEINRSELLSCDVFWALWPESRSEGTAWELGYLWGSQVEQFFAPHIVVTGKRASDCIFTANEAIFRDTSDDIGLTEVLRVAREWEGTP